MEKKSLDTGVSYCKSILGGGSNVLMTYIVWGLRV